MPTPYHNFETADSFAASSEEEDVALMMQSTFDEGQFSQPILLLQNDENFSKSMKKQKVLPHYAKPLQALSNKVDSRTSSPRNNQP